MPGALLTRPGRALAVALVLTLAFGLAASRVRFDNTPETWLPTVGEELADYERFRERFGDDSLIMAFSDTARPEREEWRSAFASLADALHALPGVAQVDAPALGSASQDAPVSPLGEQLLSADGRHAGLAIFPEAGLDGGERSRLQLAKLMLSDANFLLLDEPTNNLDLPSCEVLENALDEFEGTVLVISHDRYFLDRVVDRIVELEDGDLSEYPGDYSYYAGEKAKREASL